MMQDWFEQLSSVDVPPVPEHFDKNVRRRVNNALLAAQVIELASKGFLYACLEFSRPLMELVRFTVAGSFSGEKHKQR